VTKANTREWSDFVKRYNKTVEETRAGRVDAVNAPLVISSLGALGVRAAAPIVVPPSVGTLFIGSAHPEMLGDGDAQESASVITLSLTFDHRVVNGAGAASFVHEIKEQIGHFAVPQETAAK
jgi:2-oxoisovalerate dehydrogenase E1 component